MWQICILCAADIGEEGPVKTTTLPTRLEQNRESILSVMPQSNFFAKKSRECGQYYIYKHHRFFVF